MKKLGVRKWIWLCIWILTLVGISFFGGAVSYGLFWGVLLLPVVSFIYLLCVYLRFRIYQEIESRQVICDQAVPYFFVLRNEDRFGFAGIKVRMFPDYSFVEDVPEDVEYELLPGDEYLYRTKIVCRYRGEYEVGVKEVIITDFFGIFRFKYPVPGAIRAIVRPKLVEISGLSALSDVVVDMERESYLAQTEPDVVVRDYVHGDSMKKIHWKAVARAGKLLVRNDTGTEKQGVVILFDSCRYSREMAKYLPVESKLLESLLALTMFFARKNVPVTVFYGRNGLERTDVAGLKSFEEFYARMSDMAFDEKENPLGVMAQVHDRALFRDAKVLMCVFHSWNDEMMGLAEEIADSGVSVVAYVVTDENLDEYVKYNTTRKRVITVPVGADLEGVL